MRARQRETEREIVRERKRESENPPFATDAVTPLTIALMAPASAIFLQHATTQSVLGEMYAAESPNPDNEVYNVAPVLLAVSVVLVEGSFRIRIQS